GWLGDWVCSKLVPRPDGRVLKMRVPKILLPAGKDPGGKEVLREFLQQMDTMHDIIRNAYSKDLEKIRIPFSLAGVVKLRLGDMLRYLVAYTERYVLEAQQVMIPVMEGTAQGHS
ncbi:MAG TPA: hypothetical protein VMI35_03955, partial [Puia sp.]|nr:hypothetical protein [Puia sp.]